jgi:hypothetical protein
MKFNKKEKKIFIDKEYIIILTFPIKYLKSKKLNLIIKKYNYINISVVFSKNTNNKIYYHVWFEYEKQDYKTWSDNFKYKIDFCNLLDDLKKVKR